MNPLFEFYTNIRQTILDYMIANHTEIHALDSADTAHDLAMKLIEAIGIYTSEEYQNEHQTKANTQDSNSQAVPTDA
jgi:hypothetical protein